MVHPLFIGYRGKLPPPVIIVSLISLLLPVSLSVAELAKRNQIIPREESFSTLNTTTTTTTNLTPPHAVIHS